MRYVMPIIIFVLLMTIVGIAMQPVYKLGYHNTSETVCHGNTCPSYLFSQMGNRTINISETVNSDMCEHANLADCNKHTIIMID